MLQPSGELGRFTLTKRLGEGGFGVVFEAYDPRHQCRVAVKVLRKERVLGLQNFKREFRSLADLMHPNLVRLYELAHQGDDWYFAMELVSGPTFLEYVWAGAKRPTVDTVSAGTGSTGDWSPQVGAKPPRIDVARLRAAARELAEAVSALHAARKLHCDLKPSNVLVTNEGRVVVLDFGLVADLDDEATSSVRPLGTPGYMSPEQARREELTPATDWYSVGAMLHEVLTGSVPSPGSRRSLEPAIAPDLGDIAALCAELLEPAPARRPVGAEVLRRLGAEGTPSARSVEAGATAFFGREVELRSLQESWSEVASGGTRVVQVAGGSGMGKTALVRRFLAELEHVAPDALVLRGRCYEQEAVPYKVFDGIMDELAHHLAGLSKSELARVSSPAHPSRLVRLFPVFQQVPFAIEPSDDSLDALSTMAQRREAFLALRELLSSISAVHPLVLFLDDLHWGDVDSARLLGEVLRPPLAPRMLVVATIRPDGPSPDLVAALDEALGPVEPRSISIDELPPAEARAMAAHLLGVDLQALVDPVAREGGGHPIFIQQLAERALVSGDEVDPVLNLGLVIMDRIRRLDPNAQSLLEALAIAGHPVNETVAAHAAGLSGAAALQAASTGRRARILLTRSAPGGTLELAHDRVREAIAAATSATRTAEAHGRLAEALVASGHVEPEELVRHYEGAGDAARTTACAKECALRAESAYAFDRAAHYHALVLRHTPATEPVRWQLLRSWGDALANAGRGGDAGDAFEEAAQVLREREPDHAEVITLSRRAGEHALRSGRLDVGTRRMGEVLERVGVSMPRSRTSASALSIVRRLRLFVRGTAPGRASAPIDERTRARLDALWAASTGLSMANHVVADALGLSHLLEALDAGAPYAIVRGLGYEAAFEAVLGGAFLRRRCTKIIDQMDELASRSNDAYDLAWATMSRGITSWFLGDWADSWSHCTAAATLYRERCRGVAWELAICDAYRFPALAYLGDLPRLAELVPMALQDARERGDLFAASNLRMGQQSMLLLARDRPDEAIDDAARAISSFSSNTYLLPHYHHLFARVQGELYRGDACEAWRRVEEDWPGLVGSKLLMAQFMRVEIRHLRARSALALAARASRHRNRSEAAPLTRAALAEAQTIERDRIAPAMPFAAAIRAGAAGERRDEAVAHLERARSGFQAAGMMLYAHATSARLGALRGGDEGAKLREEANHWMVQSHIVNPESMIAMLLPGV
jgi:eukaryotic-like serine/threonine-protein kinase